MRMQKLIIHVDIVDLQNVMLINSEIAVFMSLDDGDKVQYQKVNINVVQPIASMF